MSFIQIYKLDFHKYLEEFMKISQGNENCPQAVIKDFKIKFWQALVEKQVDICKYMLFIPLFWSPISEWSIYFRGLHTVMSALSGSCPWVH